MANEVSNSALRAATGATTLISRLGSDAAFGAQVENALSAGDLNALSVLLPGAGVDSSVFRLGTSEDEGATQRSTNSGEIVINCKKCSIVIKKKS